MKSTMLVDKIKEVLDRECTGWAQEPRARLAKELEQIAIQHHLGEIIHFTKEAERRESRLEEIRANRDESIRGVLDFLDTVGEKSLDRVVKRLQEHRLDTCDQLLDLELKLGEEHQRALARERKVADDFIQISKRIREQFTELKDKIALAPKEVQDALGFWPRHSKAPPVRLENFVVAEHDRGGDK